MPGQVTTGNLLANGAVYVQASGTGNTFVLFISGNNRYLQYGSSWYWIWDATSGNLNWNNPSAANRNVQFSPNGNTVNNSGAWLAWSDARVKQDVEDYDSGLDVLCGLRPRRFRFKAEVKKDGGAPFQIGLVGQEAEEAMPEAVSIEPHSHDGVDYDDFRHVNTGPVIWALVNAVKELKSRIEVLEGRRVQ